MIMCAEIQQDIYKVVENRANLSGDPMLTNFTIYSSKKILRSVKKSELAGFVGGFGSEAKQFLNDNVDERDVSIYNNAVDNRHNVAHGPGSRTTFRELEEAIEIAKKLIGLIAASLSLQENEVS